MALLDMSDVINDIDFSDAIICERNLQSINTNGMGSITQQLIPFFGDVSTEEGTRLVRDPEGDRIKGDIWIVTTFTLRVKGPDHSADIIQWQGARYTVMGVRPYTQFGSGFVEAACELLPLSG